MHDQWPEDFRLLLIYKDEIGDEKISGSPLVSESPSILSHLAVAKKLDVESDFSAQVPLFPERIGNRRYTKPVPKNCCVWGWWRKPWEQHHNLFKRLQSAIELGKKPLVFLYNQYLRRLFKAELNDLYFEPFLTTVIVPSAWKHNCPSRYSETEHLCGAFFVLRIKEEEDASELERFYVDSSSFDLEALESSVIVPPPAEIDLFCRRMIDSPPKRSSVRTCENTVLCLRSFKQKDRTSILLQSSESSEADLVEAFQQTTWGDLLGVLASADPMTWARLSGFSQALAELGRKARDVNAVITRYDFQLFGSACLSPQMNELIIDRINDRLEFNELGNALLRWVTSSGEREARTAASLVFKGAWHKAKERYCLGELPDTYFDFLPSIEAVACAVRHEIGKKFYRDHLSHNVRAALLTAHLLKSTDVDDGINNCCVGFFSGLYHDIAMPLTTFPDTVEKLAQALASAQPSDGEPGRIHIQGILDRNALRKQLNYVALLASIPNAPNAFKNASFAPWNDLDNTLNLANKRILFEELLCASTEEHAMISAAVLLDYALRGIMGKNKVDYDTAYRTLADKIASPDATPEGREFVGILQCMALHDRRPAAEHHAVTGPPRDTPLPLNCSEFQVPSIVSIADEFQEWGRTVGAIEGIGAVDGNVDVADGEATVSFALSEDHKTFAKVPFSLFEFVFGKFRTVGKFMHQMKDEAAKQIDLKVTLTGLSVFRLSFVKSGEFRIAFKRGFQFINADLGNQGTALGPEVQAENGYHLVKVAVGNELHGRDYLMFKGDPKACDELVAACREKKNLTELCVDGTDVRICCGEGKAFVGTMSSYRFGARESHCTPAHSFPKDGPISLIRVDLLRMVEQPLAIAAQDPKFHLVPHPHLLDFDWRFTAQTCRAIINFCKHNAAQTGGQICYLGCPTLALWHREFFPDDENWHLLDRGHHALDCWLEKGLIPTQRFTKYDVFDALPERFKQQFAAIITDPPWYNPYYKVFCRRAKELASRGGILGVTHYPRFDDKKYDEFQKIIFDGVLYELQEFGAMEIDYEVPEFERAVHLHQQYEHPSLGIYRPGYMDFYVAPKEPLLLESVNETCEASLLTTIVPLPDGHHLRCAPEEVLAKLFQGEKVRAKKRKSIQRVHDIPEVVAWSTRNTVVSRADDGDAVKCLDDLVNLVQECEK